MKWILFFVLFLGLLDSVALARMSAVDREWWIAKMGRKLRGGVSLPVSTVRELARLSDEEIIQSLLQDRASDDFLLEFSLFWWGQRGVKLRNPEGVLTGLSNLSSGIHAARALRAQGDYLSLFDADQPMVSGPLIRVYSSVPGENELPFDEFRRRKLIELKGQLAELKGYLEQNPKAGLAALCTAFPNLGSIFNSNSLLYAGWATPQLALYTSSIWQWRGALYDRCALGPAIGISDTLAREFANNILRLDELLIADAELFNPDTYKPKTIDEVRFVEPMRYGQNENVSPWQPKWSMLPNSTTNFNRKRAAFVLSRFLCDDLTPIALEESDHTGGDEHGSSPSCKSCHYRLDPMAGFFKHSDGYFRDIKDRPFFRFSDDGIGDPKAYAENWKADPSSGRVWDIGLIRSENDPSQNTYGDDLKDLSRILKTAPEVRRCMTKRLFEFLVSPQLTLDPGWVDELAAAYTAEATRAPDKAFFDLVTKISTSKASQERSPVTGVCYDRSSRARAGLPCQIDSIVTSSCVSCHNSNHASRGLDLSTWENGTFRHIQQGQQVPRKEVFQRIVDRLSATGPSRRMPLMQHMSPIDRQALYQWANKEAQQ